MTVDTTETVVCEGFGVECGHPRQGVLPPRDGKGIAFPSHQPLPVGLMFPGWHVLTTEGTVQ